MAPRREPRPRPAQAQTPRSRPQASVSRRQRLLHVLAATAIGGAGVVLGTSAVALVWPERDKALRQQPELTAATLADKPSRPVTVLVIGSDANSLGDDSNGAAPAGRPNADSLLLVRINPKAAIQVLNLPVELAVNLPGQRQPLPLGSLYRLGGVALTVDAVRELVGLEAPAPDRYVVMPRSALRSLVNGVGGLEVSPPQPMQYRDRSQNFSVNLESGLQTLAGQQVEQLVRFRSEKDGEANRRGNQERVVASLRERLVQGDQLNRLPDLATSLHGQVDTNLSQGEILSLLAAGLDRGEPIQFSSLPLRPATKTFPQLRQLASPAGSLAATDGGGHSPALWPVLEPKP